MFDKTIEVLLTDSRSHHVPVLFIVEIVMILEDLGLLKEDKDNV